jgi:alpha-beta hydrolase superfamily lysophospholipase
VSALPAAVIALGALAGLAVGFSWAFARWWCTPRRNRHTATPAGHGLPFESVQFSSEGVPIRGWFIPAPSDFPPPAAIVLAHGWSGTASDLLPQARLLREAGFAVLAYDARGHGSSGEDGPITILKLARDVVAAVHYVGARPDVDERRVGVLGQSIGGGAAILAASAEPRIGAVVSCSAFADPEALTREVMRKMRIPRRPFGWLVVRFIERWLATTMADVAPRNRVALMAAPLLLVHGASDRFISASDMETLYARSRGERTERMLIPSRGHASAIEDPDCQRKMLGFFSLNLSHPVPRDIDFERALTVAFGSLFRQLGACC